MVVLVLVVVVAEADAPGAVMFSILSTVVVAVAVVAVAGARRRACCCGVRDRPSLRGFRTGHDIVIVIERVVVLSSVTITKISSDSAPLHGSV